MHSTLIKEYHLQVALSRQVTHQGVKNVTMRFMILLSVLRLDVALNFALNAITNFIPNLSAASSHHHRHHAL
jgi:hypothetical protein